jgi:hypothetical protein
LKLVILAVSLFITAPVFLQWAVFYAPRKVVRFPKTTEGEKLNYRFTVKNRGDAPLTIYGFEAECTCTQVQLPPMPIQPNQSVFIDVTFDTNGKYFYQDRVIYFATNTKRKREKLRFKVFVIPKD